MKTLNRIFADLHFGQITPKDAINEVEYLEKQITMKAIKAYNVQIWVGLKETYNDEKVHSIDDVKNICDNWVNEIKDCVTITPTDFRYVNGCEPGVIVGYISYPRFPRSKKEIRKRALTLAERLMIGLNQFRVTVTTPHKSYMLENNNSQIAR